MNGALVYSFTFTNTENISSYRNRNTVIIYKISVTTVNFDVILDVARCCLWLFTLYINIKIGKNSC